jgi:hypothetical protein
MAPKDKDYSAGNARIMNDDTGFAVNADNPFPVTIGAGPSKSAFGEIVAIPNTPLMQGDFVYGNNNQLFKTTQQGSGTVTNATGMAVIATGANTSSLANIRSGRVLRYKPGQGAVARFACLFSAGVTGNTQSVGVGTAESGVFFGHIDNNGFSIIHNQTNTREIQSVQITTKSSNSQNATVTLGGVAYTVPVTNGASVQATAWEIASFDYNSSFPGWIATAVGDTIYFVCSAAGNQTGSFSVSFPTSGVAGAFTEVVAGALGTTNVILQTAWNVDRMNGAGGAFNPSGLTLDPTKINVYEIKMQYLGGGAVECYIENSDTGAFVLVHRIKYANLNTIPSLKNPGMPFQASSRNTTNNTAVTIKVSSCALFLQGPRGFLGIKNSKGATLAGVTTAITPILSIRPGLLFNNKVSTCEIVPYLLSVSNIGTKGAQIYVYKNATLNNTANFSKLDATTSVAETDTTATSLTGGRVIATLGIGNGNRESINLKDFETYVETNDILTIAAASVTATTDITVGLSWEEEQ